MNDDLISRSALKNFINKVCFSEEEEWVKFRVDNGSRGQIERILAYIDNAQTVDITEEQAIDKLHETGWLPKHDKEMTEMTHGCTKCPFATECSGAYTKNSKKCSFYKNVPISKEAKYGLLVQALDRRGGRNENE